MVRLCDFLCFLSVRFSHYASPRTCTRRDCTWCTSLGLQASLGSPPLRRSAFPVLLPTHSHNLLLSLLLPSTLFEDSRSMAIFLYASPTLLPLLLLLCCHCCRRSTILAVSLPCATSAHSSLLLTLPTPVCGGFSASIFWELALFIHLLIFFCSLERHCLCWSFLRR